MTEIFVPNFKKLGIRYIDGDVSTDVKFAAVDKNNHRLSCRLITKQKFCLETFELKPIHKICFGKGVWRKEENELDLVPISKEALCDVVDILSNQSAR